MFGELLEYGQIVGAEADQLVEYVEDARDRPLGRVEVVDELEHAEANLVHQVDVDAHDVVGHERIGLDAVRECVDAPRRRPMKRVVFVHERVAEADRPILGIVVVVLVADGFAQLDDEMHELVSPLAQRAHVAAFAAVQLAGGAMWRPLDVPLVRLDEAERLVDQVLQVEKDELNRSDVHCVSP